MRLVAFGCSLTFGHYLPDIGKSIDKPSKLAWPSVLGNMLSVDSVENMGSPGSSNKRILDTILKFDFRSNDIVFILWSHLERYCIISNEVRYMHITPHKPMNKESKAYYKHIYNEYDHSIDFYTRANYADLLLKSKQIKVHHLTAKPLSFQPPKWNNVEPLKTSMEITRRSYKDKDFGLDGHHPGVNTNKQFAKLILKEIT
jgi:hypothetical protein